ncbi:MAG: ABC transporter ATP-binding protein [Pseudomonadota bacterium]|nr:ABC transporter ATP-binding protein [Pseudomonadota bacterium]
MSALSVQNINKTYANGLRALRDVTLEVAEGDFFALLGPNGAGKSTLIGIISSLVNKSSGKVEICGHSIDTSLEAAKAHLGVVPQEFNCNGFETVLDTLINQAGYYGVDRGRALVSAERYLKELNLWDKRDNSVRFLSGGMKRRLMIARALVHEPNVVILDEPTAGVDIEIRRSMWAFMRELNAEGMTIILTTHYLEEAESLCRNIAIIDHGEIVENTSMKALLSRLDSETFVLYLNQPVTGLPAQPPVTVELLDETTLEVVIHREQGLNGLFAWLSRHGLEVVSMRNKANRLEQLFMDLVSSEGRTERSPLVGASV